MSGKYCQECGTALTEKYLENEGMIPFCPKCNQYRFPMYNVAVSMIVVNKMTGKILLIKQYGRPFFILVAGYVNRTESLEHAAIREIKEETGLSIDFVPGFRETTMYDLPGGKQKTVVLFLAECTEPLKIENNEIKNALWLSVRQAMSTLPEWYHPILEKAEKALINFVSEQ